MCQVTCTLVEESTGQYNHRRAQSMELHWLIERRLDRHDVHTYGQNMNEAGGHGPHKLPNELRLERVESIEGCALEGGRMLGSS
jgi:hypothetical protein